MTSEAPQMLSDGARDARIALILAHGAGAPMDSAFMNVIAMGVAAHGIRVVRFEFPYMAARRSSGKRGAPDREPVLLYSWRAAIARVRGESKLVAIGGKSLGGRVASMVADEAGVAGLVCRGRRSFVQAARCLGPQRSGQPGRRGGTGGGVCRGLEVSA